jgi:uncharacterized protein
MTEAVFAALNDPETYPDAPASIERHETHGSCVFVAGERALKVKKPVVLPFLDYGTLERRRAACREEVRLNRRLAPALYLGTVGIVRRGDGAVALIPDDEAPGVVEVGVLMRRYDDADTLAARWADGTATEAQLRMVGARIAAFHAAHALPESADASVASLRQAVRTTLDDLEAGPCVLVELETLRERLERILSRRRDDLLDRARRGLVVDGHGDLRAEHVLLTDPVQIVDALEFDSALRIADVACDLGFLVMDLQGAGAEGLARALVDGYRLAGGDPGDDTLLALMGCYRSLVRAKVDLLSGDRTRAGERIAQAVALGWRARGPLLVVVCGPPATGKSTLAAELCRRSGMVHVSSDVVRKARLGLAPTERAPAAAYSHEETLATYRALGAHAAAALGTGRGAVIDATLGDPEARAALRDGMGQAANAALYVECRAPAREVQRRARRRDLDPERTSDATAQVASRLAQEWAALDEVPAPRHLVVRTDRRVDELVVDLTAWVDRRWT